MLFFRVYLLLMLFYISSYTMNGEQYCLLSLENCSPERVRVKITSADSSKKIGSTIAVKTLECEQRFLEKIMCQNIVIEYAVINKGKYIKWNDKYKKDELPMVCAYIYW